VNSNLNILSNNKGDHVRDYDDESNSDNEGDIDDESDYAPLSTTTTTTTTTTTNNNNTIILYLYYISSLDHVTFVFKILFCY
jgi:hypothetical protein